MKRQLLAGLGLAALLGLTACGSSTDVSALERDATAGDALPAGVALDGIDSETARLVGEAGDHSFYVARPDDPNAPSAACVVIVNSQPVGGCSDKAPVTVKSGMGVEAMVVPDGFDSTQSEADGWHVLDPNLLVRGI